jgi:hypothetical protein
MAIRLNNRTKLTTDVEKTFVEIGGSDPEQTLSEEKLGTALANAVETVGEHCPSILRKIYQQYVDAGELPPIDQASPSFTNGSDSGS